MGHIDRFGKKGRLEWAIFTTSGKKGRLEWAIFTPFGKKGRLKWTIFTSQDPRKSLSGP